VSTPDAPSVLNPSIVGQAEKAHNAVLDRVLAGTTLDERQWITLQLAFSLNGGSSAAGLVARVTSKAKYAPAAVETAIDALAQAGLLERSPDQWVSVTPVGAAFVGELRRKITRYIGRAYGQIAADDLATTARVLTTITAALSEELAAAGEADA
jgi:DNA-binding MarR family transcriptional regulator